MTNGNYSAVIFEGWFTQKKWEKFSAANELVLGVDAAKRAFYAAVMTQKDRHFDVLYFERDQIPEFIGSLAALPFDQITLVVEPSGTYTDGLLAQARQAGIAVMRINGERVHNAQTVFDGVPSLHDGKAAYILGHLYLCGVGTPWEATSKPQRDVRALADLDALVRKTEQMYVGPLEAFLARHWPELPDHLSLKSATLLELLSTFGCPQEVAANPERARSLMRKTGGHFLAQETIEAVIESARTTIGVAPVEGQCEHLKYIAGMLRESQQRAKHVTRQIKETAEKNEETRNLVDFVGHRTAVILVGCLGALTDYESPKHLEKAQGLNLCEHTTGKTRRDKQIETLHVSISKRGPSRARQMVYWQAMRMINPVSQSYCRIAKAWYQERLRLNGGRATSALVALMRKLCGALWHVARGKTYDPTKLFDVARLRRHGHL